MVPAVPGHPRRAHPDNTVVARPRVLVGPDQGAHRADLPASGPLSPKPLSLKRACRTAVFACHDLDRSKDEVRGLLLPTEIVRTAPSSTLMWRWASMATASLRLCGPAALNRSRGIPAPWPQGFNNDSQTEERQRQTPCLAVGQGPR